MRRSLYTTAEKEATTLRFAVGDKVLANTGEWTPGVVVRQWYQEKGWEVRASSAGAALGALCCALLPPALSLYIHIASLSSFFVFFFFFFFSHSASPRGGSQRTRSSSTASSSSLRRSITTA